MPTNFLWGSVGSVMNLLTTEMNSLAINTLTALGPEINNSSGFQEGQLALRLASAAFTAGNLARVYFVPSLNTAGDTYPTFTSVAAAGLANYFVAAIQINGSTAAQNEAFPYVRIPLGKFKTLLYTGGGCPTLASSGNTLDLYPTPSQY